MILSTGLETRSTSGLCTMPHTFTMHFHMWCRRLTSAATKLWHVEEDRCVNMVKSHPQLRQSCLLDRLLRVKVTWSSAMQARAAQAEMAI